MPELQAASGSSGRRAGHQLLSRAACCGFTQDTTEDERGMLLGDVSLTHSLRLVIGTEMKAETDQILKYLEVR